VDRINRTGRDPRLRPGIDVLGFDGQKIGTLVAVGDGHFVVEKGYLSPRRYRIPFDAVAGIERGNVLLKLTKDQALARGWEAPPST
jgi:hypothetical protein